MIESLNDRMFVSVRPINARKFSVTTSVPPAPEPVRPETTGNRNDEEKDATLPFEKWTLPPQPEGYIQYLPYDPF
ncbi:MAG TPA: hypothetical protein VG676_09865 [Chitinophagaceae bacterium]|jgi:hypothetical protein|nr:hypothetical protein [Chitinophagaceae bacterium]